MRRFLVLVAGLLTWCHAHAADLACNDAELVYPFGNTVVGRLDLNCRLNDSVGDTNAFFIIATDSVRIGPNAVLESFFSGVTPGTEYLLIRNDGAAPIDGIFPGYPEGQVFTTNAGGDFRISYHGGDGNDVTVTALPPAKAWTGGAGNLLLSDGGNWSPAGAPQVGDRLLVPASITATLVNDLPVGFLLGGIKGGSYSGNAFTFVGYITNATFSQPVDLQGPAVVLDGAAFNGPVSGAALATVPLGYDVILAGAGTFSGTFFGPGPTPGRMRLSSASYPAASMVNVHLAGTGTFGDIDGRSVSTGGAVTGSTLTLTRKYSSFTPDFTAGATQPFVISKGRVTLDTVFLYSANGLASPVPGEEITLIRNDSALPVSGTFLGMPEGTVIPLNGAFHRLSYRGGDGNDVTLKWMDRIVPRMASGPRGRDFNGDGRGDLAWLHPAAGAGAWLVNGLSIVNASGVAGPAGGILFGRGDFNGDARADLLWRTPDGSFYISLMNGLSSPGPQRILEGGSGWEIIGIGDFNGDGRSDLLWRHTSGAYGVWLMSGTTIAGVAPLPANPSGYWIDALGDFDGDGRTDLLWRDAKGNAMTWLMNGTSSTTAQVLVSGNQFDSWSSSVVADFNGDGIADVVSWDTSGKATVWLLAGGQVGTQATLLEGDSPWRITFAGDLDGDGKADLVWASTDGSQGAWLMNGVSAKSHGLLMGAASGWSIAGLADLDGNGTADLVWRYVDGSYGAWLMGGLQATAYGMFFGAGTGWELFP